MRATETEYKKMLAAMRKAEKTMPPVLDVFRDQVLFLKHNLNARAIASIKTELTTVQRDVAALIKQMESSIAEAEQFIRQMQKS
jgi:uridine kinase